jgi:AAA family ATP:ADP antiporter
MLYSVVTPEEKYKSKNFIDTAVYRGGDLIGTWTVRALWGLGFAGISMVMLPFALLWVAIALWVGKAYRAYDSGPARGSRR